ncbi:SAM-dependent methyltransferase [Thermobifida halotolerans]|uniref:SAM-dependent methyltransferase n=1 Tax=Thermobifida halotolerans TaxID=483545 RepID=A0AA97M1K9_9ACTN|nr:SAM-dependent methyltransferase [Thermobifida halotolerans]
MGRRLLEDVSPGESAADPLKAAERLRRHPALSGMRRDAATDLVNMVLTQTRLRMRAEEKFGPLADRLFFTPDGLEQATRAPVAAHRARRFAELAAPDAAPVADLCCGIGADLLALAGAGLAVEGVDLDPLTAAVAEANIGAAGLSERARVRLGDATEIRAAEYSAVFCDPARRGRRGRVFDPRAYSPSWDTVVELARRAPAGCVKAAPGLPHESIPDGVAAEWVSVDWEVKETALWFGAFTGTGTPSRRATLLRTRTGSGEVETTTLTGRGLGAPPVSEPLRYLYEPDGAVVRSHLVAEAAAAVDGALLDPAIAYITSDSLVRTPLCRVYEVREVMPFSLKRLRAALRERGVGTVTVKKRGSAVDVQRLRRDLRLAGPESAVVVLTRIGSRPYCLLCAEVGSEEAG